MHVLDTSLKAIFLMGGLTLCQGASAQTDAEQLHHVSEFFSDAQVVSGPTLVDCTLTGGTGTTCFSITVKAEPLSYTPGPWCPRTTSDDASAGGIWLQDGEVHDVDGAFIEGLSSFYGDANWQLFDQDTGAVRYTGTLEACQAAARPDVDPAYQNYCVECLPEYMPDDATMTYVIPLAPTSPMEQSPTNFSGSGVAYNGIRLDGPAPVSDILSAYTLAPFDDCGGHVNTHVGYHYHAVTDCLSDSTHTFGALTEAEGPDHGPQIGIAMDGYQIFSHHMADGSDPVELDICNGHDVNESGYHYHAGSAGSNAILSCVRAEAGCALEDENGVCDASKRPQRP